MGNNRQINLRSSRAYPIVALFRDDACASATVRIEFSILNRDTSR